MHSNGSTAKATIVEYAAGACALDIDPDIVDGGHCQSSVQVRDARGSWPPRFIGRRPSSCRTSPARPGRCVRLPGHSAHLAVVEQYTPVMVASLSAVRFEEGGTDDRRAITTGSHVPDPRWRPRPAALPRGGGIELNFGAILPALAEYFTGTLLAASPTSYSSRAPRPSYHSASKSLTDHKRHSETTQSRRRSIAARHPAKPGHPHSKQSSAPDHPEASDRRSSPTN